MGRGARILHVKREVVLERYEGEAGIRKGKGG